MSAENATSFSGHCSGLENICLCDLRIAFAQYGNVDSAEVIMDRQTGRSRGIGFVEMSDDGEAQASISAINGADPAGRPLTGCEAKPHAPRTDSGRW